MNEQEKLFFKKLVSDREENAKVIEKSSMEGVKSTVVEKYSEHAHFIYELLQNADDAKATKSEFRLTAEGLYFSHNGGIHFTVTDPDTEKEDKQNDRLGHINSITSIGQSSKITESTIGKFGVGFKAVFQYTETPHIYDPNFQFKIERFIVPQLLPNDLETRKADETVFYFPFDEPEMPKKKAYDDILDKLKHLVYPTLFLSNLQDVSWETWGTDNNEIGKYQKKTVDIYKSDIIPICEKIELSQTGLDITNENLWLFTRKMGNSVHTYSVGFFLDDDGRLWPKSRNAFCFFPTKVNTGLNFIIHAPFLLTDSREGIKMDDIHNKNLVKMLAKLAADCLLILKDLKLIDDDIIKIIPYKEPDAQLFAPFYEAIKDKFQTEELLPSKDATFARKANAYWVEYTNIVDLYSNDQIADLLQQPNTKLVFSSIYENSVSRVDKEKAYYINNITNGVLRGSSLLDKISAYFIKKQNFEWLHSFYAYINESTAFKDKIKTSPIFIDTNKNAVAAFDNDEQLILFLPTDDENSSYTTIHNALLENEKTKEFIVNFGIKEPDLKDEIYNHILPLYDNNVKFNPNPHFKKFFQYYKECKNEDVTKFLDLIKDKAFIRLYKTNDKERYRGAAKDIYYPSPDLQKYFETKPDTNFVDLDCYHGFITEENDRKLLKDFLLKLGVSECPRIIATVYDSLTQLDDRQKEQVSISGGKYFDKKIDGCEEILEKIDADKSKLLWKILSNHIIFAEAISAKHTWRAHHEYFESTALLRLRYSRWVQAKNGDWVAPHEITVNELSEEYDTSNSSFVGLLNFKPLSVLSETEKIARMFENEADAKLAKELLDKHKAKQNGKQSNTETEIKPEQSRIRSFDEGIDWLGSLQKDYSKKTQSDEIQQNEIAETEDEEEMSFNEDEEFAKGIDILKEQLKIKKDRKDLVAKIEESTRYSYNWFESYLKLLITYGEKQNFPKQKSISFQKIKQYKEDDQNYFMLYGTNRYISSEIEDAEDFKLTLVCKNKKENIIVEVEGVSKKGQDLLIYCREALPQHIISRFSDVERIEINFLPLVDLLTRLQRAFSNRNYLDEWQNIQEVMPALEYIYGPPGTGKTTILCERIEKILTANPQTKFLVLTPTNKAADVLCKKLWNINSDDILTVRLGHPTDPDLEEEKLYRDTITREDLIAINVIASTIHRLPYFKVIDEKASENKTSRLFQNRWDYVIFDESSMTGLHYIVFAIMALHKTNASTKFIIAGDPKQIPPVLAVNDSELENLEFQDENIYTMMGLESFNPEEQTIREIDKLENLDLQYRSIKQIGQLFSELSYSGLLKHDREKNRTETKPLPEKFKSLISTNVTFIDIPLSEDISIYKINKLLYSSYQIYCAILMAEIIKFFDEANNDEQQWTVGLIAPYKAQALLLNKLVTSYGISGNVKVCSDTVHGFQGDECDIVFFVCNPNNDRYTGHKKCLLSKEYIYNVAISRAKDYLVILHPYSTIYNNKFINSIKVGYSDNFGAAETVMATKVERILFNKENFIEDNSYVTGHDTVNVFGLSDMKYFIKVNDNAIDIQLKK